ncbi:MAG: Glu-tRNA(Gln) amidotransferase subunit GatE, partial [Thermoplasmatota archaeon]
FEDTESSIIAGNLKKGKSVMAVKLPCFSGLLRGEDGEALLGPEMADYAKKTGVAGIFHSDELPKYGITQEEVDEISDRLKVGEKDAFALVTEKEERCREALEKVIERARSALEGVPEETRNANLDGTTSFSRPLSGEARMYPETDIPPKRLTDDYLDELKADLPERPEERIERHQKEYNLNRQQSRQLFRKGYDLLFEEIVEKHGNPSTVANMFLHDYPEIEKEGYDVDSVDEDELMELFQKLNAGDFAKEGIPEILKGLVEGKTVDGSVKSAGLESVGDEDVREIVVSVLEDRSDFVEERGMGAMGPLMGVVMKELRGKADGEKVSSILKEELQKRS